MNDSVKKILVVVISAVLLGGYVWWYYNGSSGDTNHPNGIPYICENKECGNIFRMTEKEVRAHYEKHYGEAIPCPKCLKSAVRGIECANCKSIFKSVRGQTKCPSCGKELDTTAK